MGEQGNSEGLELLESNQDKAVLHQMRSAMAPTTWGAPELLRQMDLSASQCVVPELLWLPDVPPLP